MAPLFGRSFGSPDHPMSSIKEVKEFLAELPQGDPFKALQEITSWLTSIRDTPGFRLDARISIVMLLDETAQPLQAELLANYLSAPHLQDFAGLHLWQGIHDFMRVLADSYALCTREYQETQKHALEQREKLPVVCVRLLRAASEQMKLELMRYIDVDPVVWERLYGGYRFAEEQQFAETMVFAYPKIVLHTNTQRELLRGLMLYESSPGTLAADQIEVGYRIAGRLVSFFDFKAEPDADCGYFVDLAKFDPPALLQEGIATAPSRRFFGAGRALPKIKEIIAQHEHGAVGQERRFGSEFTPEGKLTVLKHLEMYWEKHHPHRALQRREIHATIEITHGFRTISKLVARVDLGQAIAGLSGPEAAKLKEHARMGVVDEGEAAYVSEHWAVQDVSLNGIGGTIPKGTGAWVKVGDLCGIKAQNSQLWWVGMLRRLHTDGQGTVHVGLEILAKKPLSLWLRVLGKGIEKVSDWETSSGSFHYDYLPAIMLPDAQGSYVNATMLIESGNYVMDAIYEVMLGERSREIRLTALLDEGEDYERVCFQWLNPASLDFVAGKQGGH